MSWLDMLGDHYRLGYAMNTLCLQGVIRDCRFYQSPLYQSVSGIRAKTSTGATIPGIVTPAGQIEKSSSTAAITAAANEYRLWAPASGRYAIGGKYSVKSQIDYTVRYPQSKSHRDSRNFLSSTDRARANTWAKTYQGTGYRAF